MKSKFTLLIGVIVALALVSLMFAFQVYYDEVAVVTTFDRAGEGSVKREARLYLRWPWPVQKVTTYSTLNHTLDGPLAEKQTKDSHVVIIRCYIVWRINDPLRFFEYLQNVENAEDKLGPIVGEAQSIVSQYRFNELVAAEQPISDRNVRLTDLQREVLRVLDGRLRDVVAEEARGVDVGDGLELTGDQVATLKAIVGLVRGRAEITLSASEAVAFQAVFALPNDAEVLFDREKLVTAISAMRRADVKKVRLDDFEKDALEAIQAKVKNQDLGIEVVKFGVRRIVLPQDITPKVFERQKTDRQALAEHTKASGKARADEIRSRADSIRGRVLAFVEKRANRIRTRGLEDAAEFYDVYARDEALAIDLLHIRTMAAMLVNETTVTLDTEDVFSSFLRRLRAQAEKGSGGAAEPGNESNEDNGGTSE